MSVRSVIGGMVRGLVIAAATAGAAFGALVVFEPFGRAPPPVPAEVATAPASLALQQRIEELRLSLRDTEMALDAATSAPTGDSATRAQYEAQIAAAIERRDLARRHAEAIRESLDAGVTPSSLAAIRDSVVIGQLLAQQSALDAQIAIDGARFRSNHPTMLALNAQRNSLVTQIRREAANIASALESEAKIDDAQIKLLEAQLPTEVAQPSAPDTSLLEAKAATQRAELDSLVDAYFNIPPAAATVPVPSASAEPFSIASLAVVGVAFAAAMLFQILLAIRRPRRPAIPEAAAADEDDIEAWDADQDPEVVIDDEPIPLRKAS
jgi:hypothetical protein